MIKRIVTIIILIVIFIFGISTNIFAAEDEISWIGVDIDVNSYKPGAMGNANTLKDLGNTIIGSIQFVGSFTAVIVLMVIGIKYMVGSVEEKAEYKKTMMPYIIGAIFVFGITNILAIIEEIAQKI